MCFSQMIISAAQPAYVTSAVESAGNMQTGEQQEGGKKIHVKKTKNKRTVYWGFYAGGKSG